MNRLVLTNFVAAFSRLEASTTTTQKQVIVRVVEGRTSQAYAAESDWPTGYEQSAVSDR